MILQTILFLVIVIPNFWSLCVQNTLWPNDINLGGPSNTMALPYRSLAVVHSGSQYSWPIIRCSFSYPTWLFTADILLLCWPSPVNRNEFGTVKMDSLSFIEKHTEQSLCIVSGVSRVWTVMFRLSFLFLWRTPTCADVSFGTGSGGCGEGQAKGCGGGEANIGWGKSPWHMPHRRPRVFPCVYWCLAVTLPLCSLTAFFSDLVFISPNVSFPFPCCLRVHTSTLFSFVLWSALV